MRHPFALVLFPVFFGSTPAWPQSVTIKLTGAFSYPAVCDAVGGGSASGWDLLATTPDAQHIAIPSAATAIGMWINPHGFGNKLMAKFRDSHIPNRQDFTLLNGYRDQEYNFNHTQDSRLLLWDGWRFVTMPFNAPYSPLSLQPLGSLMWLNPFYIEDYSNSPIATMDICGITYLM